jgi:ATP-dependent helicase/nuclease subunit B
MKILFDPDFDRGYWPGPLQGNPPKIAAAGEAWVGFLGLLNIFETALGLGGPFPSTAERAAALARAIVKEEGFWSASAEKDPIGVARTLLHWIDWLRFHGWRGQAPGQDANAYRLRQLAHISSFTFPGIPDRLNSISAALHKHRPDIASIETFEPVGRLLPLWKRIFEQMRSHALTIKELSVCGPVSPNSDLGKALLPEFSPAGDGSLRLLRSYGPLEAAEQLAAWLSAEGDIDGTVVICAGAALDQALQKFGLPVTGAWESRNDDPFLQVLPLVLAMGWDPPDPQRVLELLLIPDGPIPGQVSRQLRYALQQWPAVGSEVWSKALEQGLEGITDASQRDLVRKRIEVIFRPEAKINSQCPASALKIRAKAVRDWAQARLFAAKDAPSQVAARLPSVISQCNLLERLIDLSGFHLFSEPQLLRLMSEINDSIGPGRRFDQELGMATVASPGAVAGPARRIIWWDFTLELAPSSFAIPLSRAELVSLESEGVRITAAKEISADAARRWRRPLLQACETLILVCPVFGEDGEERHPHPLWDEIRANLKRGSTSAPLETKELRAKKRVPMKKDPVLVLPQAKRSWRIQPGIITPPPRHSATSIQNLIGCPFKWTLSTIGQLRDPEIAALTDSGSLVGLLSHEILAEVLRSSPADSQAAETLALELFETKGPRLAAPLFLPGAPVQLAVSRNATAQAARDLTALLQKAKLQVLKVESPCERKIGDLEIAGRFDLLAGNPPVIIDLKWRGETYHRDHLKNGTAVQLAAYAFMLKSGRSFPSVAFFIISNQHLIGLGQTPFTGAERIDGPALEDTWKAVIATALRLLGEIKSGRIEAPAVPRDDEKTVTKDELVDDGIVLSPPCRFCHFGFLCGVDWGSVP